MQVQVTGVLVVVNVAGSVAAMAHVMSFCVCDLDLAEFVLQKGLLSQDDTQLLSCLHRCAGREGLIAAAWICKLPAPWLAQAYSLARHVVCMLNALWPPRNLIL